MTIETNKPRTLEANQVVSFEARPGLELIATRGRLWITQDGDPRDVFVQPGQRFRFDRRGPAVVHALHAPGAFVVTDVPAQRGRAVAPAASHGVATTIASVLRTFAGKPARA